MGIVRTTVFVLGKRTPSVDILVAFDIVGADSSSKKEQKYKHCLLNLINFYYYFDIKVERTSKRRSKAYGALNDFRSILLF